MLKLESMEGIEKSLFSGNEQSQDMIPSVKELVRVRRLRENMQYYSCKYKRFEIKCINEIKEGRKKNPLSILQIPITVWKTGFEKHALSITLLPLGRPSLRGLC